MRINDRRSSQPDDPEEEKRREIIKELRDLPFKVWIASMCNPNEPGAWIKKYGKTLKHLKEYSSEYFTDEELERYTKYLFWNPNKPYR